MFRRNNICNLELILKYIINQIKQLKQTLRKFSFVLLNISKAWILQNQIEK